MSRRDCKIVMAFFLLCVLSAWTASAGEVLVRIHPADIKILAAGNFAIRFQGKSFLLVQGDESEFAGLSLPHVVLDKVEPDVAYYLTRSSQLSRLKELDIASFTLGDSALLRIHRQDEHRLMGLGLPLSALPENIALQNTWMAPKLKSQAEIAADAEVISEVVRAVNTDALRDTIYELQENNDLDSPHTAYRSRYCLRVRETDDPSDDACDNAAELIFRKFESYGVDVQYDPFPHEVLSQGHYQMRNVVATLPGKGPNSDRVFIICSHYDTIGINSTNWTLEWRTMPSPGADDNASGTAAVLEAARILSKYDFNCTIKFIAFSGEELRLHGSIHYAKLADESEENIAGVLNLDMIAYDPNLLDIDVVTNEASEWLVETMLSIQEEYGIRPLLVNRVIDPEFVYSDHAPFWNHGWNSVLVIDNHDFDAPEFYPFMHTTEDTIDKLDFDLATRTTQIVVGALASLADPLGGTPHPDLAVTEADISLLPENPDYGQSVQVTANIRNVGEADAENVRVQIWLDEPLAETPLLLAEELVGVQVDGSAQISASLDLMEWGNYHILIKANSDYQIFETNGSNNRAGKDIGIGSASLALGELMIYPNPVQPNSEEKVNIAYALSKDASTRLDIYSIAGELVYRNDFAGKFGSNNDITWDGTNLSGEKVAGGVYFCYVVATDEHSVVSVSKKLLVIR